VSGSHFSSYNFDARGANIRIVFSCVPGSDSEYDLAKHSAESLAFLLINGPLGSFNPNQYFGSCETNSSAFRKMEAQSPVCLVVPIPSTAELIFYLS